MKLDSGTLVITLADNSEQGKEITLDLIECKLAAEDAERRHTRGKEIDTIPMLRDLAQVYQQLGVEGCTPTGAWQLYQAVNQQFAELKKNITA